MDETRTIIIGISGCSSSGKTTLARFLRDMFPETFILHEDDFYKPESELPINQGHADWDCPEAISIPDLEAALAHVRTTGTFPVSSRAPNDVSPNNTLSRRSNHGCASLISPAPLSPPLRLLSPPLPRSRPSSTTTITPSPDPLTKRLPVHPPQPNLNSLEDLNTVGPCPATPEQIAACAARVNTWLTPGQPGAAIFPGTPDPNTNPNPNHHPKKTRLCILDGFLLYSPPPTTTATTSPLRPIMAHLDIKLFLHASRAAALQRRTARDGYVHMDGFWKDPPGYVEQVVWPNYAAAHRWLFEGGDVERGRLDGGVLRREGILAPPSPPGEEGGGENGGEVGFGRVLEWAVGAVMGELERVCLREGGKGGKE